MATRRGEDEMANENIANEMADRIIEIDVECKGRIAQAEDVWRRDVYIATKKEAMTKHLAKKHKGRQLHEMRDGGTSDV